MPTSLRIAPLLVILVSFGAGCAVGVESASAPKSDIRRVWLPTAIALGMTIGTHSPFVVASPGTDPDAPVRVSGDLLAPGADAQPETQAEPYLVVDPQDAMHLLACYQESRFSDGGARTLAYAVSFDGGTTWDEGLMPNLTVVDGGFWDRASDPWVAFGPTGRAYFASLLFNRRSRENAIGVSSSEDGGRTWSPPVIVHRANAAFNDKEAIVVDTSPASPHFGNVYVAWDVNVGREGQNLQRLVVSRSTDEGRTWSDLIAVRRDIGNVGVVPRVGPDGTVYLVWMGAGANNRMEKILFAKSSDGGATWTKARRIEKLRSRGVQGYRSGAFLPAFDVDSATGDLVVVWPDARWTGTDQPTLSISRDGGATWSDARRIGDEPDDSTVLTPSVAASAGSVHVSYYSFRNDPEREFGLDLYLHTSTDGGATFGAGERLTPETFDARFGARANGLVFFGDYAGLAAAPGVVYAVFVAPLLRSVIDAGRLQPDAFSVRRSR